VRGDIIELASRVKRLSLCVCVCVLEGGTRLMELTSSLTHTVHTQVETVKENENKQGEREEKRKKKSWKSTHQKWTTWIDTVMFHTQHCNRNATDRRVRPVQRYQFSSSVLNPTLMNSRRIYPTRKSRSVSKNYEQWTTFGGRNTSQNDMGVNWRRVAISTSCIYFNNRFEEFGQ
jgi:hypothetical protein